MPISEFDHLVLNVADVERSLDWYRGLLGLEGVRVDEWRRGEVPFPSVRVSPGCIIDLFALGDQATSAGTDGPRNMNHLCLRADRADVDAILADDRIDVFEGPVPRFGARGEGRSVYVHDPDGNTVEIRDYDLS